jgi:hypothetical protein
LIFDLHINAQRLVTVVAVVVVVVVLLETVAVVGH